MITVVERARELRPVALSARDLLLVDSLAAGRERGHALVGEVLVADQDAGAADQHGRGGGWPDLSHNRSRNLGPNDGLSRQPPAFAPTWVRLACGR